MADPVQLPQHERTTKPLSDLRPAIYNPRKISAAAKAGLTASLRRWGLVQPIVWNKRSGSVVGGHQRLDALELLGQEEAEVCVVDLDDVEEKARNVALNNPQISGEFTAAIVPLIAEIQAAIPDVSSILRLGEMMASLNLPGSKPKHEGPTIADRFIVPPFTVLDARQGYWQDRKRLWLGVGIRSEVGRGGDLLKFSETANQPDPVKRAANKRKADARTFGQDIMRGEHEVGSPSEDYKKDGLPGVSIFDPVLCELAYRWFCPLGGAILDPFAGGSVRGVVAGKLGRRYTGIELRAEQVAANRKQAADLLREGDGTASWVEGDSRYAASLAPGEYDFVFSCPPYADLERYSDDSRDLSTLGYDEFVMAYREIIAEAMAMLQPNRFACFVVGDVRAPDGTYRNFPADTIAAFLRSGAQLYNEAILVTSVGSLPIRIGKQFTASRKLGKTHQNVLVFVKGDPKKATEVCGTVEVSFPEGAEGPPAAEGSPYGEEMP